MHRLNRPACRPVLYADSIRTYDLLWMLQTRLGLERRTSPGAYHDTRTPSAQTTSSGLFLFIVHQCLGRNLTRVTAATYYWEWLNHSLGIFLSVSNNILTGILDDFYRLLLNALCQVQLVSFEVSFPNLNKLMFSRIHGFIVPFVSVFCSHWYHNSLSLPWMYFLSLAFFFVLFHLPIRVRSYPHGSLFSFFDRELLGF